MNALILQLVRHQDAVEILRHVEIIGISAIVPGELLSGFAVGSREVDNRRELSAFLDSPRVVIFSVDEDTAEFYAHTYLGLKRRGNCVVVSVDDDLRRAMAGVQKL